MPLVLWSPQQHRRKPEQFSRNSKKIDCNFTAISKIFSYEDLFIGIYIEKYLDQGSLLDAYISYPPEGTKLFLWCREQEKEFLLVDYFIDFFSCFNLFQDCSPAVLNEMTFTRCFNSLIFKFCSYYSFVGLTYLGIWAATLTNGI